MRVVVRVLLAAFFVTLLVVPHAQAQYFGRNKVQWEQFDFKVLQTEHFDIYYYEQEADVVEDVARMAERWYARLSRVFNHSFRKKPIVLYANSADFHQTTTTGGTIGEGTGGFTDAFMNRVVLPLTGDYAQNDHVLGHEIVHVFQYDIAANANQQRRRFALEAMPLWLVEGMAEYFSKGRVDPLTSMWIRDATIQDTMPDLEQLTRDSRYFPYRYGQALMAYIGARFGDEAVVRYFMAAGTVGIQDGVERALGITHKQLFADWSESARELYDPILAARPQDLGNPVIGRKPDPPPARVEGEKKKKRRRRGSNELNIGPALSPDGRYIAYLSARELFSIDLFLSDAKTGQVIRRLVSSDRDAHFESLRFIESAGAWSPDSKQLAFITFSKGDNFLSFVDVETRRTEHVKVPNLEAIINVAWSPDGQSIVISGQTTGVSDLFLYDVASKQVRRLTADKFADLQPAFSPDGKTIAFVSDRGPDTVVEQLRFTNMRLATIDVASGQVREINAFRGAKHINPQWSPDGRSLYFIANPEGIPDLYRIDLASGALTRLTALHTGIAGITDMSPALTVASRSGDIAFSVFESDNYNIYSLPASTAGTPVTAPAPMADNTAPRAALLPPLRSTGSEITGYLMRPEEGLPPASTTFAERNYKSDLHLSYLGPPTLGVGVGEFGFGAGGSVTAFFSDILGRQNIGFTFQGGGGSGTSNLTEQLGGEVFYLNQTSRLNWGADLVHSPQVYGSAGYGTGVYTDPDTGQQFQADIYQQYREVQLITDATALAQYPFSATRRVEGAVGAQRYSFKRDVETFYIIGNQVVDRVRESLPGGFVLNFSKGSAAFVGDSTTYGFISPINGTRYRYEVEALRGDLNFQTALADWRKYFFWRPVTLAVRGLHYGRYGNGANDPRLSPLYLGRGSLLRGYDPYSINPQECGTNLNNCPVFDRLIGTRIAAASIEVRAPLLGTREFGLIDAAFLPTEAFAFADGGGAWSPGSPIDWRYATNTDDRVPVFSVGVGLRILLAYIPIEVYAAKPFQRPGEEVVYGFNITPGW
jgi:WD40 repeat protein